jgi:hypothetical protein
MLSMTCWLEACRSAIAVDAARRLMSEQYRLWAR